MGPEYHIRIRRSGLPHITGNKETMNKGLSRTRQGDEILRRGEMGENANEELRKSLIQWPVFGTERSSPQSCRKEGDNRLWSRISTKKETKKREEGLTMKRQTIKGKLKEDFSEAGRGDRPTNAEWTSVKMLRPPLENRQGNR